MLVNCESCGKPVAGRRPQARTCSARCRKQAQRARNRDAPQVNDGVTVSAGDHEPVPALFAQDPVLPWPLSLAATEAGRLMEKYNPGIFDR